MKTKEFIVALIFILASLAVYVILPVNGAFQQVIATLVFFVILPILFNFFILKRNIKAFNVTIGNYKQGLIWGAYALLATGFIFLLLSYFYKFLGAYGVPSLITKNFGAFLLYEFLVVLPLVAVYEFYFRGFVMPILEEKLKYWSILVQAAIFIILVLGSSGGNLLQFVPYLVVAPLAGIVAYKSRSILYSGAVQFLVVFVLNVIVIKSIG